MAESASSQHLPSTSWQFHDNISLETNSWYTKYFYMIDKWGHKIPYYSIINGLQSSYKAITEDCLLQDISYYTCIEIVGMKNLLKGTLKKHCNPQRTFAAKRYTNGEKEGTVMFFKKNGYPQFPIGYVNFFWKPSETDIKTIWIWVHPAFYSDFLNEIISSFEFKEHNSEQNLSDISFDLIELYTNDAGCEMRVLKYDLNRFRLSGPAALTILKNALRIPSLTELDLDSKNTREEQDSSLSDEKLDTSTDNNVCVQLGEEMVIDENETHTIDWTIHGLKEKMWHTEYYKERENIEAFKTQGLMWEFMKALGSPKFLPSNMIIGLTVLDPRPFEEVERTRPEIPSSAVNLCCPLPTDLSRSPIWNAQILYILSSSCIPSQTIDKLKPGMSDDPDSNEAASAKIPILLIQKPAVASSDLGSSIDIIIPCRWAMAFWMALIKQSPSVGGLRDTELIVFESLRTNVSDINDPDTPAYMRNALARKEKLTKKHFPEVSRIERFECNKFGVYSPFFCDWKNLTKGWSGVENFYVLRDSRLLALLKKEIKTIGHNNASAKSTVRESEFNFQEFDEYQNCLIQVKLSMVNKGKPKEFAVICTPTLQDLERFEDNSDYDGPVEKYHPDPIIKYRKILYNLQFIEFRLQSRKRSRPGVKRKRTCIEDNVLAGKFDVFQDEISLAEYQKMLSHHENEMRKCLLELTEVRHSCDREIMGYVTMGGKSFLRAKCIGIGYVALPSLLQIIRKQSDIVLVRNNTELQYRFARLEILADIKKRNK